MGIENVRLRLANAEVAGVAEVFCGPTVDVRQNSDAGVAEVAGVDKKPLHVSNPIRTIAYEGHAEVAGVFDSLTRAQARARAREEASARNTLQPVQPLHMPGPVTILRHCRCADCLNFSSINGEYFCSGYIGGTAVIWATGQRICDPQPNQWHYCASYRGPQVSKDVWVWPRTSHHVCAGSTIAREVEQPDKDEVAV